MFVTDNNVNSEHEMSTAKSLCYMAPPAQVSKCQPRKMLPILVTAVVNFLGSYSNLKLYECTLTSVRTAFITNLQSTIFKDRIGIFLSHYPEWEHELLIMASLFPFSKILWNFEIYVYTSTDV